MGTLLRRLTPVSWTQVRIEDSFWTPRRDINRTATLPREYELLKKSGTFKAYQWDWWDPAKGKAPWRIWVGDLGKWIEACSYSLATNPDPQLAARVEEVIRSILKGQKADGYLYSNPIRREQRWANLQENHELYDVGHTIEGAVAHFKATGQRHFLDAMGRCADLLADRFGREKGKKRGYDGHPEIELALMRLYGATGEKRYLKLAKFYIDERGRKPLYFEQERAELKKQGLPFFDWYAATGFAPCQAHKPLREQEDAVGHAVRAMYLYSGAVDVAIETGDRGLLDAGRRLWKSAVRRRMYVIGAVGSTAQGEAFTTDHDLPNETGYAETCANIALVFFAHRLLQAEPDSEYADVMERALYNGVLSGVSLDGCRFFYANHLAVHPGASVSGYGRDHVAATRQDWFGCACCPPNLARLIASLGQYAYSVSDGGIHVHLYMGGEGRCEVSGVRCQGRGQGSGVRGEGLGVGVTVRQETGYPWTESVKLTVEPDSPVRFQLALRIPGWCRRATVRVNGKPLNVRAVIRKGYAYLDRTWKAGDRVDVTLPMPVERVEAHPAVRMDCGKVALQRGPVVYCLEEADNGKHLADLFLPRDSKLTARFRPELLGGCVAIRGKARRRESTGWTDRLYSATRSRTRTVNVTAVPYCLWGNRNPGEMLVWMRGE